MGGSSSSPSSHTEPGKPGAPGAIFMGISPLDKIQKGKVLLVTGNGGKENGAQGGDTILKLSDGTVLGTGTGGGKASKNTVERGKFTEWDKYGKGGSSEKPGDEGYGVVGMFTLKITNNKTGESTGGTTATPTPTPAM